jgi:hypothetical protein
MNFGEPELTTARRIAMFASNKILPAFALALMLASGAANAIPHPHFGDLPPIDLHGVGSGLDEGIKRAAGAVQLNTGAYPEANVRTSR